MDVMKKIFRATKLTYNESIQSNRIIRHISFVYYSVVNRKEMRQEANIMLTMLEADSSGLNNRKALVRDMFRMYRRYGYSFAEYVGYGFQNKTLEERLTFVADWEHIGYTDALNDAKNAATFDNKVKTYNMYKQYYHREIIQCDAETSLEEFLAFWEKWGVCAIKPLKSSSGKGFQIIRERLTEEQFERVKQEYGNRFLAEELIVQDPQMGKFHPSSVNTVRVTTIRMDDDVCLVWQIMRIGQGGSCVDNGGAGGILCALDSETGIILAARDKYGKQFYVHPDTGEILIGHVVPEWNKAVRLVKELAEVVPSNRYTAWDLAFTNEGWVLVEANRRGQFVGRQVLFQSGFRGEIEQYLRKLGKKY